MAANVPFGEHDRMSVHSIERLREWLQAHCDPGLQLTANYTVGALISDLEDIEGGVWNDGIDAMGEDA